MKIYIVLLAFTFLIGCGNSKNHNDEEVISQIKKAEWILGRWGNTTDEGDLVEIWEKANDSTFIGRSYFVSNDDTIFSEEIRLAIIHDTLYYIPSVKNQNFGQPVYFQLSSSSENHLVFENKKHDFPQFISYTKISDDSLLAIISGEKNGKMGKVKFPMKRMR